MTPMETHALDRALHWRQLLAKAIEEKGADYVYQPIMDPRFALDVGENDEEPSGSCLYFEYDDEILYQEKDDNGEVLETYYKIKAPSCIVGHGMYYDSDFDLSGGFLGEGTGVTSILDEEPQFVRAACEQAQMNQDTGGTWGESLYKYDLVCVEHVPGYAEAIGQVPPEAA